MGAKGTYDVATIQALRGAEVRYVVLGASASKEESFSKQQYQELLSRGFGASCLMQLMPDWTYFHTCRKQSPNYVQRVGKLREPSTKWSPGYIEL